MNASAGIPCTMVANARTEGADLPRANLDLWSRLRAPWVMAACALLTSACTLSPSSLRPREVTQDQGAMFGHVEVVNGGENVTRRCYVSFFGETEVKAAVSLDDTGWIFKAVRPGTTYLARIICTLGSFVPYNVQYLTHNLRFDVPGGGTIAYFGHVRVDMSADGSGIMAAVIIGGLVGGLVGSGVGSAIIRSASPGRLHGKDASAEVENHFDEAQREYQRRYGEAAAALAPEVSIAAEPALFASGPSPANGVGFVLGQDVADAEKRCTGAHFSWKKLDDGRLSCSGAPIDLGVPATVTLAACQGVVCEVAVNVGRESAAWSELTPRFTKLLQLLDADHGDRHESTNQPMDCPSEVQSCFAAGLFRKSATWRWPNQQTISLVLDGGPHGSAPSLVLVYATGARVAGERSRRPHAWRRS